MKSLVCVESSVGDIIAPVETDSPFLNIPADKILASNEHAFAFYDRYPVSPGHTLIVTKRVVPTFFDATYVEQYAMIDLVNEMKSILKRLHDPDGFNIGINCGAAAGQTVMHVHIHVIPRYTFDVEDPFGGVRGVIPAKRRYAVCSTEPKS